MSDPSAPLPPTIAFTSTADEVTRFRLIAWRSFAQAVPSNVYWIVVLGMFVVIGFAVLAAQKTGTISAAEVPSMLFAAYLSYGCGAALHMLLIRYISRRYYAADKAAVCEVAFSDGGLLLKADLIETRVPWQAVRSIEAWRECMLIWFGQWHGYGYAIPARLFPDDAARASFVKSVRLRIASAKQGSH